MSGRQRLGGLAWLLIAQFFVANAVVALAWPTPYSLARNVISDLGAVGCAESAGGFVCSPWHPAMNVSFVLTGVCIALGGVLLAGRVGRVLLAVAGLGMVLVGVFPSDVNPPPHTIGAAAAMVAGNGGILACGIALRRAGERRGVSAFAIGCGVLGLLGTLGLLLLLRGLVDGMDVVGGAVQRVAVFPMLIGMIAVGVAQLTSSGRYAPR